MRYDDRVRFSRPGQGGSQDPATGVFTAAPSTVLYDGACDAQDVQKVLQRDGTGLPILTADISVFLPWGATFAAVETEDDAAVTFADGTVTHCKVIGSRHLDRIIYVKAP